MPIKSMLAHSPSLPLTVDYANKYGLTTENEEKLLLALNQRHRVRHLRLTFPAQDLQRLLMTIDGEFPILEYLILWPRAEDNTVLILPETFQAPNLRHLTLESFACPI